MGEAKEKVRRIFIGGLGANVTADDLEKTFMSLGRAYNIEFVRSDGRNFAYMDFEPNSDKSLDKLFAKYNGCTWKGGKLRLEKAKEHYLDRLKREWAEDAKDTKIAEPEVKKETHDLSKLIHVNPEKMQLQIFFPKLKKVKALPFKGSGKHKYSFQRVEIPSMPIHFCDCEEHYESAEAATEKCLSTLDSLAYEKEKNIMNAVMNKFLGKKDNEVLASRTVNLTADEKCVDAFNNEVLVEEISKAEDEYVYADEENLVTNIGIGQSDEMLMHLVGKGAHKVDQKIRIGKRQSHTEDSFSHDINHPLKKQKIAHLEDSGIKSNFETSHKVEVKTSKDRSDPTFNTNRYHKGIEEKEKSVEVSTKKSQMEHSTNSNMAATRTSWTQKSSWRNLVGGSVDSLFSISNILPCIGSAETKISNAKDSVSMALKQKSQSKLKVSRPLQIELQVKEAEFLDADPDNLVMNIVRGQSDDLMMHMIGKKADSVDQVQQFSDNAPEPTQDELPLNERQLCDQNIATTVDFEATSSQRFSVMMSKKDAEGVDAEHNNITEVSPGKETVHASTSKPATGNTWIQKSAWRDLVSDSGNSSFNISTIIPGTKLTDSKLSSAGDVSMPSHAHKRKSHSECDSPLKDAERLEVDMQSSDNNEESKEYENKEHQKANDQECQRSIPKFEIGSVCTFMRSAESKEQWNKAKKALSGYLNKKSSDKNASKESRGKIHKK